MVSRICRSRVLDEVALPHSVRGRVGEQATDRVDLVVAGPDLGLRPPAGLLVLRLNDLGVALDDVGQSLSGENLAPQVVRPETGGIRGVAGAVVPAAVERQEP